MLINRRPRTPNCHQPRARDFIDPGIRRAAVHRNERHQPSEATPKGDSILPFLMGANLEATKRVVTRLAQGQSDDEPCRGPATFSPFMGKR